MLRPSFFWAGACSYRSAAVTAADRLSAAKASIREMTFNCAFTPRGRPHYCLDLHRLARQQIEVVVGKSDVKIAEGEIYAARQHGEVMRIS